MKHVQFECEGRACRPSAFEPVAAKHRDRREGSQTTSSTESSQAHPSSDAELQLRNGYTLGVIVALSSLNRVSN